MLHVCCMCIMQVMANLAGHTAAIAEIQVRREVERFALPYDLTRLNICVVLSSRAGDSRHRDTIDEHEPTAEHKP